MAAEQDEESGIDPILAGSPRRGANGAAALTLRADCTDGALRRNVDDALPQYAACGDGSRTGRSAPDATIMLSVTGSLEPNTQRHRSRLQTLSSCAG